MFANMVVSALIPLSSSISPYLVMGVRFSQGLGQVSKHNVKSRIKMRIIILFYNYDIFA